MTETALDYRVLFEAADDVVLVLLPDAPRFTMVAATRARLEATMTTAETFGKGLFEVFPDNPDDAGATGTSNLRASLERVVATRAADTMAVQKYDIRAPDGTFQAKYWSPRNVPVLGPGGDVRYILHRVVEVTELVRASEIGEELRGRTREMEREVVLRSQELHAANLELRAANAKLGELDAAKTAFFSNVSHEFRTPLTLMLGPLEDALADATLAPAARKRVELAHANALRLLKLVNTLLDFSRLEAGRFAASYAPLDVAALSAEQASMFQSAVEPAGLRLVIDCPPLAEPAWVDRDMWEKIVSNLVSNAYKFTLTGHIAVRVRDEAGCVSLEVSDTGVGIAAAELPRIFERFHRVEGSAGRAHEGTGIGLALVRELVTLHGGTVEARSTVGEGTTFRVELPKGFAHLPPAAVSRAAPGPRRGRSTTEAVVAEAARWHAGAAGASSPSEAPPQAADDAARARVLVVDDNPDVRNYVTDLLTSAYDVTTAVDGQAALDVVKVVHPDIVLSDVMMPRLDGFGLLRALRADPATTTLPVILLSARAGEEASIEGLDAGADDYLIKPFSARELVARVRTNVALQRKRRAWIAELERANRDLDSFSYSVSHDLRAPLRAIDGFSRALAEDCADVLDERGREHVARVHRGVARMSSLIEALLDLSRLSRVEVSSEDVDLSALANAVVADLRQASPTRTVIVDIADGLVARGDRRLLNVVLVNLLGNAWKFTGRVPEARITMGREDGGERAFGERPFFVRDNGAGFDVNYAKRLFAPFQRFHGANEFEGTGIGLATVQRVIAKHGGRIWAEAAPDRGATFFFTLGPAKGR